MTDDAAAAHGTPRPAGGPAQPDDAESTHRTPPTPAEHGPGEQSVPGGRTDSGPGPADQGTPGVGGSGAPGAAASGAGWPGGGPGRTPPEPGGSGPDAAFAYRYGLVRPREGRYLAGVCAAIGRATDSDPILWRVLLAVLGFFGGIGILVYVAAWLIIPAEGDTASPVESMLGRGRSSMSPVTVLVLGILVAVMFGFIVTDTYRAMLLGVAVLIGGALLLNRQSDRTTAGQRSAEGGTYPPPAGYPGPGYPPAAAAPVPPTPGPGQPPAPGSWPTPAPPGGGWPAPAPTAPAWSAGHRPAPTARPGPTPAAGYPGPAPAWSTTSGAAPGLGTQPPAPAPATGYRPTSPGYPPSYGYRPPFAPHGPYAGSRPRTEHAAPPTPPKPPRKPRERSRLGAATFSLIFVAVGVVAILDLTNVVDVGPSAYFAAALVTIALGLLVGAWFGRARWLIALGLVASCALGVSTAGENYRGLRSDHPVVWAPTSYDALADRYQAHFGSSTLDLTRVDFTGRNAEIRVEVSLGEVTVLLPPEVDVTVRAGVHAGDAVVLGRHLPGNNSSARELTDVGADGPGGGTLRLTLNVNVGHAEVIR